MQATLGLVAAALVAAALPARADLTTVKVTIPAIAAYYAPDFIAIDKGYFAEAGLQIEIVEAGGGVGTPALISGTVDFSASPAAALAAILRGAPLKIIYTMADRATYQLWSTEPNVTSLAEMKGKSVGIISRGDTFEIAMRLTLIQQGFPQDWLSYTALGFGAQARDAAMASGSLPAVIVAESDLEPLRGTPALARSHLIVDMYKTLRWPYTGMATSDKLLATKPDMVERFLGALVKGVRYMKAFKPETLAILAKREPQAPAHAIEIDYDAVIPTLTDTGTASDALIRQDLDVRAGLMNIPKDKLRPASEIYDYRLLEKATAALDAAHWQPSR